MEHVCKYVDVFYGCDKSAVPPEGSLSGKWHNFKGKAGNTSPGASLPFQPVCCVPHSGGYPTGYGRNCVNYGKPIDTFFDGDKLIGFAHFSQSGSGAFGFYYNYLLTVPFTERFGENVFSLKDFDKESAVPGYYRCHFTESDIDCEVTVAEKTALHRYTAKSGDSLKLAVDISNNGLWQDPILFSHHTESRYVIRDNRTVDGYVVALGVKLFFCIKCDVEAKNVYLFRKGEPMEGSVACFGETEDRFGVVFETEESTAQLKIGFSLVDEARAETSLSAAADFDTVRTEAYEIWENHLSAIEIDATEEEKELFYSNFYQTLTKPCQWKGESFLWDEDETFCHDMATLWDVYKTQLPLIFTLYRDIGENVSKTLIRYGKEKGDLVNCLMLNENMTIESAQASCLGAYALYDAYVRGLVDDVDGMFFAVKAALSHQREDHLADRFASATKILDVACIAKAFEQISERLERDEDSSYFAELANHWEHAFDADGLMRAESKYYEGFRWNYSFRLTPFAQRRVELGGGKEKMKERLDAFFAFNEENEMRGRFEGFNNESDMETPYFYLYVDGRDRFQRLMDECLNVCFQRGRNGIPGNNDSGALSACYMWNFMGLFPATGQDIMFLGIPKIKKTVLHVHNGNDLTIVKKGTGNRLCKITWNGISVDGYSLPLKDLMNGGELVFSVE